MHITKKLLNENKIYNAYGIAEATGKNPFIAFTPKQPGRVYSPATWQIIRIGYRTDPKGAGWRENYNKTFTVFLNSDKDALLVEAKAWVKNRYSLDITERDVWGNWHVTGTMDKLKALILNQEAK